MRGKLESAFTALGSVTICTLCENSQQTILSDLSFNRWELPCTMQKKAYLLIWFCFAKPFNDLTTLSARIWVSHTQTKILLLKLNTWWHTCCHGNLKDRRTLGFFLSPPFWKQWMSSLDWNRCVCVCMFIFSLSTILWAALYLSVFFLYLHPSTLRSL